LIADPDKKKVGKHAYATAANLTQSHKPDLQVAKDIAKRLVYSSLMTRQVQISIQSGEQQIHSSTPIYD
jgi:hypothetical protein